MEMSNSRSYWLMINSNSGGCSTGGSASFAPFRIRRKWALDGCSKCKVQDKNFLLLTPRNRKSKSKIASLVRPGLPAGHGLNVLIRKTDAFQGKSHGKVCRSTRDVYSGNPQTRIFHTFRLNDLRQSFLLANPRFFTAWAGEIVNRRTVSSKQITMLLNIGFASVLLVTASRWLLTVVI